MARLVLWFLRPHIALLDLKYLAERVTKTQTHIFNIIGKGHIFCKHAGPGQHLDPWAMIDLNIRLDK